MGSVWIPFIFTYAPVCIVPNSIMDINEPNSTCPLSPGKVALLWTSRWGRKARPPSWSLLVYLVQGSKWHLVSFMSSTTFVSWAVTVSCSERDRVINCGQYVSFQIYSKN